MQDETVVGFPSAALIWVQVPGHVSSWCCTVVLSYKRNPSKVKVKGYYSCNRSLIQNIVTYMDNST
jgi:hypothetical protein